MVVPREIVRDNFLEKRLSALGHAATQFSGGRVMIDFSALRIRRLLVDPSFSERQGIGVDRVASAMLDMHGMIRDGRVQIGDGQRPAFISLGVVVLETENPFSRRRFRSPLAESRLNRGNRAEIAVHHAEMHEAGWGGMRMSVNKTRRDGFSAKVDFL